MGMAVVFGFLFSLCIVYGVPNFCGTFFLFNQPVGMVKGEYSHW